MPPNPFQGVKKQTSPAEPPRGSEGRPTLRYTANTHTHTHTIFRLCFIFTLPYLYIYIYIRIHIKINRFVYIYIYIHIYIYIYTYIYIYIHMHPPPPKTQVLNLDKDQTWVLGGGTIYIYIYTHHTKFWRRPLYSVYQHWPSSPNKNGLLSPLGFPNQLETGTLRLKESSNGPSTRQWDGGKPDEPEATVRWCRATWRPRTCLVPPGPWGNDILV